MTGTFFLHRYQAKAVLPACCALIGFQVIALGMMSGEQPMESGIIISQKSRKCLLAKPVSRESVFEKSFF
jgi:hypothetical protein